MRQRVVRRPRQAGLTGDGRRREEVGRRRKVIRETGPKQKAPTHALLPSLLSLSRCLRWRWPPMDCLRDANFIHDNFCLFQCVQARGIVAAVIWRSVHLFPLTHSPISALIPWQDRRRQRPASAARLANGTRGRSGGTSRAKARNRADRAAELIEREMDARE